NHVPMQVGPDFVRKAADIRPHHILNWSFKSGRAGGGEQVSQEFFGCGIHGESLPEGNLCGIQRESTDACWEHEGEVFTSIPLRAILASGISPELRTAYP